MSTTRGTLTYLRDLIAKAINEQVPLFVLPASPHAKRANPNLRPEKRTVVRDGTAFPMTVYVRKETPQAMPDPSPASYERDATMRPEVVTMPDPDPQVTPTDPLDQPEERVRLTTTRNFAKLPKLDIRVGWDATKDWADTFRSIHEAAGGRPLTDSEAMQAARGAIETNYPPRYTTRTRVDDLTDAERIITRRDIDGILTAAAQRHARVFPAASPTPPPAPATDDRQPDARVRGERHDGKLRVVLDANYRSVGDLTDLATHYRDTLARLGDPRNPSDSGLLSLAKVAIDKRQPPRTRDRAYDQLTPQERIITTQDLRDMVTEVATRRYHEQNPIPPTPEAPAPSGDTARNYMQAHPDVLIAALQHAGFGRLWRPKSGGTAPRVYLTPRRALELLGYEYDESGSGRVRNATRDGAPTDLDIRVALRALDGAYFDARDGTLHARSDIGVTLKEIRDQIYQHVYTQTATAAPASPQAPQPQPQGATRRLYPADSLPPLDTPTRLGADGPIVVFTTLGRTQRIRDDDPSTHGAHLLGREGELGQYAHYRPATPTETQAYEARAARRQHADATLLPQVKAARSALYSALVQREGATNASHILANLIPSLKRTYTSPDPATQAALDAYFDAADAYEAALDGRTA